MVQLSKNSSSCFLSSRLSFLHQAAVATVLLLSSSCYILPTTAWTPPPRITTTLTTLYSTSSSSVDELYYNPTTLPNGPGSTNSIFDTPTTYSSEEMEIAARNYGAGTTTSGSNSGSGASQQKITLTRWLSAKVQDYPEVCFISCCVCLCAVLFIVD